MSDESARSPNSGLLLLVVAVILIPVLSTIASFAWYSFRSRYLIYGSELGVGWEGMMVGQTIAGSLGPLGALVAALVLAFVRARWVLAVGVLGLFVSLGLISIASAFSQPMVYHTSLYLLMPLGLGSRLFLFATLAVLAVLLVPGLRDLRAAVLMAGLYLGINLGAFLATLPLGLVHRFGLSPTYFAVMLVSVSILGVGLILALGYGVLGVVFPPPPHPEPLRKPRLLWSILAVLLTAIPISLFWAWSGHVWSMAHIIGRDVFATEGGSVLEWTSTVVPIATAFLLMIGLGLGSFLRLRFSAWWLFSAGAFCWTLCCVLGLLSYTFPLHPWGLLVWGIGILTGVGEVLIAAGLWAGLAQGQHWRAVGPLLGFAFFLGSLLNHVMPKLVAAVTGDRWEVVSLNFSLTLVCLVNALICVGIGLAMVWLHRPEDELDDADLELAASA